MPAKLDLEFDDAEAATIADAADEADLSALQYAKARVLAAARRDLRPALPIQPWLQCADGCGQVFLDAELKYDAPNEPAPCCGARGVRALWPTGGVGLHEVAAMDLDEPTHLRAAVIFLCASLEVMLGEILTNVLRGYGTHPQVAEFVLAKSAERRNLIDAYKRLGGQSTKEVLDPAGFGSWHADWDAVVGARNKFSHGGWYASRGTELRDRVQRVTAQARAAMAALHNGAMENVRARTLNPRPFAG